MSDPFSKLVGKSKVSSSKKVTLKKASAKKKAISKSNNALLGIKKLKNTKFERLKELVASKLKETGSKNEKPTVLRKFKRKGSKHGKTGPFTEFQEEQSNEKDCYDYIITYVIPLFYKNINHSNGKLRHAAVTIFGYILEDFDSPRLKTFMEHAIPLLIKLTSDKNLAVQGIALRTMYKVCDMYTNTVLSESNLHCLLQSLYETLCKDLDEKPHIGSSVCWVLAKLGKSAYDDIVKTPIEKYEPLTYRLSGYFEILVSKLLEKTERYAGTRERFFLKDAYRALLRLVISSPTDCYRYSLNALPAILEQSHYMLSRERDLLSTYDEPRRNEMKYLLCSAVMNLLKRMKFCDANDFSDGIMAVFLEILSLCNCRRDFRVFGNVLLAVSKFAKTLGENFLKYMDAFEPYLFAALENDEQYHVCSAAIYFIRVISCGLSVKILPYCDKIMKFLLNILSKKSVDKALKPQILLALANIAFDIEINIWKYLEVVIPALLEVAQTTYDPNDTGTMSYVIELHESCLFALSEIIRSLKGPQYIANPEINLIKQHIPEIVAFITRIAQDPIHTDTAIAASAGILGDLCWSFDVHMLPYVDNDIIKKLLSKGRHSKTEKTKSFSSYAARKIRKMKNKSSSWSASSIFISNFLEGKYSKS